MNARARFYAALTVLFGTCGAAFAQPGGSAAQFLSQGWSDTTRQQFYYTSQGSQLVPYSWFVSLESPTRNGRMLTDDLVPLHGYLPSPPSDLNRDGLPVGFVRDDDPVTHKSWLGLTCAACHTGSVEYQGHVFQIDGGPATADVYRFLRDVDDAIQLTSTSDTRFQAFLQRVTARETSTGGTLRQDLKAFAAQYDTFRKESTPSPDSTWGPGRTDAFSMIFNRVSSIDLGVPANSTLPNAPVSYPHLWGTSWLERVQWDASAPNSADLLRLTRNVGEVLGVFAHLDLSRRPRLFRPQNYESSVRVGNQADIEKWVKQLTPPKWEETNLPRYDPIQAAFGALVFKRKCAICHGVRVRQGEINKVPWWDVGVIGTDPAMAGIRFERTLTSAANLEGVGVGSLLNPKEIRAGGPTVDLVADAIIRVIRSPESVQALLDRKMLPPGLPIPELLALLRVPFAIGDGPSTPSYKARPLDGIWATGPYLHNGSVPTLYDLLLPPNAPAGKPHRPAEFWVGSREFDPERVGYRSDQSPDAFRFDTSKKGNHNTGHLYGTDLEEPQRLQLLEFLKTL